MMRTRALCALAVCMLLVPLAGCQSHAGRVWCVEEQCSPADLAVRSALQKNLPKIHFSGIALGDVIGFLRDVSEVNFHVRWDMLRQGSVDQKTPVNVQLTNVTIEKALRTILDDVGAVTPLGFVIDGGVVTVTTQEDLRTRPITRVYDVAGVVGGCAEEQPRTDELVDLIRTTVAPDTWMKGPAAGTTGSVTAFQHKLVIVQTRAAHERIALLLEALQERTPLAPPAPALPTTEGKRVSPDLAASP